MADELGFEISAKVDQALTALGELNAQFLKLGDVFQRVTDNIAATQFGAAIIRQTNSISNSLNEMREAKERADAAVARANAASEPASLEQLNSQLQQASALYNQWANYVNAAGASLGQLQSEYARSAALTGENSQEAQNLAAQIEQVQQVYDSAVNEMNLFQGEVVNLRAAISDATAAQQEQESVVQESIPWYQQLGDSAKALAEEFGAYKAPQGMDEAANSAESLANNTRDASSAMREFNRSSGEATRAVKKNDTFFAQLSRSIKNITFYRLVRGAIKSVMNAAIQASQAMAIWSQQFDTGATGAMASYNDNVSSLAANMLYVRNTIMAAAEPIISALTPAFNMLADAIARAFNWLAQFFSALTGRSFYAKAIKNNVNYANSLNKGNKAQKNFLAGFDELEVVQQKQGKTAGETLGVDPGSMWKKEEISAGMKNLTEPFREAMDNLRSIWDSHAESLKTAASDLWQSIGNLASTIDTSVWEDFFGQGRIGALLFNDALTLLTWTFETLSGILDTFITPFVDGFLKGFSDSLTTIYEWVETAMRPAADAIADFFDFLLEDPDSTKEIAEIIGEIAGKIAGVATAVALVKIAFDLLMANPIVVFFTILGAAILFLIKLIGMCKQKWDEMVEKSQPLRDAIQGVKNAFDTMAFGLSMIVGAFTGANKKLGYAGEETFPGLQDGIEVGWRGFKEWWSKLIQLIIDLFTGKFKIHSPSKLFEGFGENIIQGLINGMNSLIGNIGTVIESIKKKCDLGQLANSALKWGQDMVQGFADGIRNAKEKVGEAVHSIADKISALMHFSRPDEGPLRNYEQWMPDFMRGLANGIDDNSNLVYAATGRLAAGMQSALSVPSLGIGDVNGSMTLDASSVGEAQANANQAMADVFWQGCMAVVQAINSKDMSVSIGDDVIGRAASRYDRKQSVINGGAF
nr:MAG TPA: tail tape measure protein [Bacteriophage sp.]